MGRYGTPLKIQLFGQFAIWQAGQLITGWPSRRAEALLAYLISQGRPVARESLATMFWYDSAPEQAFANLRKLLSSLRSLLPNHLIISRQSVAFPLAEDCWLDTAVFRQQVQHIPSSPEGDEVARLETAVGLYRGDFLQELRLPDAPEFTAWAALERERLRQYASSALHALLNYSYRQRHYQAGVTYARQLLALDDINEANHRWLLLMLAHSGQHSVALAHYDSYCRHLQTTLHLTPAEETRDLVERIRTASAFLPELPQYDTPLIGRTVELGKIALWLANPANRLLTLVGPGGIGKSRLALQAAAEYALDFLHGVYFLPLEEVDSPTAFFSTLATVLKINLVGPVSAASQIVNFLRPKSLLLLLDGCETLLAPGMTPATELLGLLLQQAPGIKLLATSRERFNFQVETVLEVSGLPTTAVAGEPYGSAIDLFQQRAPISLPLSELETISQICALVEGLPLGIELAAALLNAHTPAEILAEIQRNQSFLARQAPASHRHDSLRAVFESSWQQLTVGEQQTLLHFSLFRGGCTAEAIRSVAAPHPHDLLALVDKSILQLRNGRYQVHELLRQFAAARLAEMEETAVHGRYARFYNQFMQEQGVRLKSTAQLDALNTIRRDRDNVRFAWQWAAQNGRDDLIALAQAGLSHFYDLQGDFQAGLFLIEQAIPVAQAAGNTLLVGQLLAQKGHFTARLSRYDLAEPTLQQSLTLLADLPDRAAVLNSLGDIARLQGDMPRARQYHEQALLICRAHADQWETAATLAGLGNVAWRESAYQQAHQYSAESLQLRRQLGDERGVSDALNSLGLIAYRQGKYDEARQYLHQSLAIKERLDDRGRIPPVLNNLGIIADVCGDYAAARRYYEQSVQIRREIGEQWGLAMGLNNLGVIAFRQGNYAESKALQEENLAICRAIQDAQGIANALTNLGLVAEVNGEYAQAEALYHEALAIRQERNDRRSVGWSYYHLGYLNYQRGNYAAAAHWLQESQVIREAVQDRWGWLFTRNGLGRVALAQGNLALAEHCFRDVLTQAEDMAAVALRAITGWAALLAAKGETETAVCLLNLVHQHPATEQQTRTEAGQILKRLPVPTFPPPALTLETASKLLLGHSHT